MAERTSRAAPAVEEVRLVEVLTDKMRRDLESASPPVVVLNRVPQTRTAHILVIWDQWGQFSLAERSAMIGRAYEAARPGEASTVTIALGLTPLEALRQGYLPYRIVPSTRAEDQVTDQQILDAMRSVGGVVLHADSELQLRFPTRRLAEEAYRALFTRVPLPVWTLAEEVVRAESA